MFPFSSPYDFVCGCLISENDFLARSVMRTVAHFVLYTFHSDFLELLFRRKLILSSQFFYATVNISPCAQPVTALPTPDVLGFLLFFWNPCALPRDKDCAQSQYKQEDMGARHNLCWRRTWRPGILYIARRQSNTRTIPWSMKCFGTLWDERHWMKS